jgi:hypothetical protein
MIETILLAILVAKSKGYRIKPIFMQWEIYPVMVSVIVYIALNVGVFLQRYSLIEFSGFIESVYICTFLFLIVRYKLYFSAIFGSIFIFIGTSLNKIAIFVNGGKMPVFPTLSYLTGYVKPDTFEKVNDIHVLGSEITKWKSLTDIFDLGYSILSIGDLFIRFFTFIIIYDAIKYVNKVRISKFCIEN